MTREAHLELRDKYRECAIQAIAAFRDTMDKKYWEEYKTNSKLANNHPVIAHQSLTRNFGKKKTPHAGGGGPAPGP